MICNIDYAFLANSAKAVVNPTPPHQANIRLYMFQIALQKRSKYDFLDINVVGIDGM